jgi:3-deoxy-manno-octulosonate cytidylyltransferase (CMP-KDO synthetase)
MKSQVVAIIPARYASTRFPGKPLAEIAGKAMLRHVYDNVIASNLFDQIIIATDDDRIGEPAKGWGADVMITLPEHPSGTDRCNEVVDKLKLSGDAIVVNIQGDEPFISREPLETLLSIFDNDSAEIGTLCQGFDPSEKLDDPNAVKVVFANDGKALYFSRAVIPFVRENSTALAARRHYKHIGLYAYKASVLQELGKLKPGALEKAESLEQLRWLENGYGIYVRESGCRLCAVDTPEDLERAERFYWENS